MGRTAARVLFSALAVFAPVLLFGQDVFVSFMVEGPRISRTAFTNWEKIELAYTVRYLDGCEPVFDNLKPQLMNFGKLELDSEFAEKNDIRNKRRFENENFFDIVYHLRYMAEKKGELDILGPKFPYRQTKPGNTEIEYFPSQNFTLVYNTVLPKGADYVKEELDLGSYQKKAIGWKVFSAAIVLFGVFGSFVLVFFKPVPAPLPINIQAASAIPVAENKADLSKVFSELEANIAKGNLGAVCNGLSDVIRAYAPGINPGMTSKDMIRPIISIPHNWERGQLLKVHSALCNIEDYLFSGEKEEIARYRVSDLPALISKLKPWPMYRRRLAYRFTKHLNRRRP